MSNKKAMKTMKCKDIQLKLISYLDGELPKKEAEAVQEHLAQCNECSALYVSVKEAWSAASVEKIPPQPFFYTRLKQRIENQQQNKLSLWSRVSQFALQPAMVYFVVLASGIFIGIQLGKGVSTGSQGLSDQTTQQEENYIEAYAESQYLNGLQLETIEQELIDEEKQEKNEDHE